MVTKDLFSLQQLLVLLFPLLVLPSTLYFREVEALSRKVVLNWHTYFNILYAEPNTGAGRDGSDYLGFGSQGDAVGKVQGQLHVQPGLSSAPDKDDRIPNRHDSVCYLRIRRNGGLLRSFPSHLHETKLSLTRRCVQIMLINKTPFKLDIPNLTSTMTISLVSVHTISSLV